MGALLNRDRPNSVNSSIIQSSEFILDAFDFTDPARNTTPELSMKAPWIFVVDWIKRGKVLNTGAVQTITFEEDFLEVPVVTCSVLRLSAGKYCFPDITSITESSFDVSLINYDGTVHSELTDYVEWTAIL